MEEYYKIAYDIVTYLDNKDFFELSKWEICYHVSALAQDIEREIHGIENYILIEYYEKLKEYSEDKEAKKLFEKLKTYINTRIEE